LLLFGRSGKNLHDNREKNWSEKDPKKGDSDHSREDGGTQRLIHFGSRAFSDHKRQHAKNESKRCHEDWPQNASG
jgi:hypothetical protein